MPTFPKARQAVDELVEKLTLGTVDNVNALKPPAEWTATWRDPPPESPGPDVIVALNFFSDGGYDEALDIIYAWDLVQWWPSFSQRWELHSGVMWGKETPDAAQAIFTQFRGLTGTDLAKARAAAWTWERPPIREVQLELATWVGVGNRPVEPGELIWVAPWWQVKDQTRRTLGHAFGWKTWRKVPVPSPTPFP